MNDVENTLKKIKELLIDTLDENISDYDLDDEIEVFLNELYKFGWDEGYFAGSEQGY